MYRPWPVSDRAREMSATVSTKAWMTSFSQGLDIELRAVGSPVKVQALCLDLRLRSFMTRWAWIARTFPSSSG